MDTTKNPFLATATVHDALDYHGQRTPCPRCGSTTWDSVQSLAKDTGDTWTSCSNCIRPDELYEVEPLNYERPPKAELKPFTIRRITPGDTKTTVTQELPKGATLTVELNPHGEHVLTVEYWLEEAIELPNIKIPLPQLIRIVSTGGRIERIIKDGDEPRFYLSAPMTLEG